MSSSCSSYSLILSKQDFILSLHATDHFRSGLNGVLSLFPKSKLRIVLENFGNLKLPSNRIALNEVRNIILKSVGKRKPNERQTDRTAKENERKFATCLMRYFLYARLQIQMVKVRIISSVIGWLDLISFRYSAQLHTPAVQLLKQQTMKTWKRKRRISKKCKEFI